MIALSEVLLENGADFKAKTKRERSRVSSVCVWLSPSYSAMLPCPDGATKGSDAMALAARKYHINVVRALVRAGADPTLPVDGGQSAIEMMPGMSLAREFSSPMFRLMILNRRRAG